MGGVLVVICVLLLRFSGYSVPEKTKLAPGRAGTDFV